MSDTSIGRAIEQFQETLKRMPRAMKCSECLLMNESLVDLGEPEKPRMVCLDCCKRALEAQKESVYSKAYEE